MITRSAATSTAPGILPPRVGLALHKDGQWLLAPVRVPTGKDACLEDLVWFRFEQDQFGRSRDWDGHVELVAFDAGGPRVAVRCSSTRRDGAVAYHDGHQWRQTGVLLRGGVDYLLRTVVRTDQGTADIYLIEPGSEHPVTEPIVTGPISTQPTTTRSIKASVGTARGPYAVRPLLSTGRRVRVASAAPYTAFMRSAVRRTFRVTGRPLFATVVHRWQLWDATRPAQAVMDHTGRHVTVALAAAGAIGTVGRLDLVRLPSGRAAGRFHPQVGLHDDFRSPAGWSGPPGDRAGERGRGAGRVPRVVDEQGGPALRVCGLGAVGDGASKAFLPPRVPFDLRVVFKLPPDTAPMRTIDLVRLIRRDTRSTIGPYVQLLAGMHDLGNGKWAARLAAQVGQPQPVVDGNPVHLDTWYELVLRVDPITGTYTAALTALGEDRPAKLYTPATQPASGPAQPANKQQPPPKPAPVFGGNPQKFFGLSRLPNEMALLFQAEGAYRTLGLPIELDVRPSFVLPVPDNARPWTNPATMRDMTCRDGRLEILNSHGGGSLLTIDLVDGTMAFTEKAFGDRAGQALAWDQVLGCYWWVQPAGRFLLERRLPDVRHVSMFSPKATTRPAARFRILPAPAQVTVDGKLDEWDRRGGCGPLTNDGTQVGTRDATVYAMHDDDALYLAAEVHDADPLINVAVPAGKQFDTGDLVTFRLGIDPSSGASSRPSTQPAVGARRVSLHLWYNHQQKKEYVVIASRTAASQSAQPAGDANAHAPKDVRIKMSPWTGNDPRGKGYTLEVACPWGALPGDAGFQSGDTVWFSSTVVWGNPAGSQSVDSVTAYGGVDSAGAVVGWGRAVLVPPDRPAPLRRDEVIPLQGNARLAATANDLFCVTPDKGIFHLKGKTGKPETFDYRKAFNPKIQFAGVAADEQTLLLAGPYGAPNAATILAVNLSSGQPIRRFSLKRYVKGITSLATDGKRLYCLAANDRMILGCDWTGRRLLGLTAPVLLAGLIDIEPANPTERLDLITTGGQMPNWSGAIKRVKDDGAGVELFTVQQATLAWPKPTLIVGDTLGQFRTMRLQLRPVGPAQALRIALQPKPTGKPRGVYVATLDAKSASQWPLPERRTTAKTFFAGPGYVRDEKSPLRQFKPPDEDELVFLLPAGSESTALDLDLVKEFGLAADTWVGQIQMKAIGTACKVDQLAVHAAETAHPGAVDGMLIGDVIDLEHVGHELLEVRSDLEPAGRDGDELTVSIRSANDRTELGYLGWRRVVGGSTASRPASAQPQAGRIQQPIRLGRYLQWRLGLSSIHTHEPPSVSTIRLVLAGGPQFATSVVQAGTTLSWRTWWPAILGAPVACWLIWLAFFRRRARPAVADEQDKRPIRKGRFYNGP